jgi:hypothetical protein
LIGFTGSEGRRQEEIDRLKKRLAPCPDSGFLWVPVAAGKESAGK